MAVAAKVYNTASYKEAKFSERNAQDYSQLDTVLKVCPGPGGCVVVCSSAHMGFASSE